MVEKEAREDKKEGLNASVVDCSAIDGAMYVTRKRDGNIEARDAHLILYQQS